MQAVLIVMPIFILIGLGWFLQQKKRFSPQSIKEINFFLYWFALPSTLFRGILGSDMSVLQDMSVVVATWLPYLVTLVITWMAVARKETPDRSAVLMLCAARGNQFLAGIPIIALAMGIRGVEAATLILAVSMAVMQLLTLGAAQLAMYGTVSWNTLKNTCVMLLKNPLFMACVLGLLCAAAGLSLASLPLWMRATLGILADVSTGMALVLIGAGINLKNIFKNIISVWKIALFKLVVFPAVTYVIFMAFGLSQDMIQAGVLLAAMPAAVNIAVVAQEMGMDGEYCAMGVTVTTFLSLFTLPFLIHLLGLV